MDKLKKIIEYHSRWSELMVYVDRIEMYRDSDPSVSMENAKALLETIAHEICSHQNLDMNSESNMSGLLKSSFKALGIPNSQSNTIITRALGTIGQEVGTLRNTIGVTAHGKPIDELKNRNKLLDTMTLDFLLNTVVSIGCLLINLFEVIVFGRNEPSIPPRYAYYEIFNEYLDSIYLGFEMGEYSYPASEVLFYTDPDAYKAELDIFETLSINIDDDE